MDMNKMIADFRQLQRERKKSKLLKQKMWSFRLVAYQRGVVGPVLHDVTVIIHRGVAIHFLNQKGEIILGLCDTNITSFDSGESDDEGGNNEPTRSVEFIIYEGRDTVLLEFKNVLEKKSFVTLLREFLNLSDNDNRDSATDSGRSLLQ